MRLAIFLSVIFLFFGCNDKQKVGYFGEDRSEQQILLNTKRHQIDINKKRYVILTTYLNPLENKEISQESEKFLVSFYSKDKSVPNVSKVALNDNQEGVKYLSLDTDSIYIKFSPVKNKWNRYFLIQAPLVDKPKLTVTMKFDKSTEIDSTFIKDILK